MALPFSSIPSREQVLASGQRGFVVFNYNGRIYQQVICCGCPDCQFLNEAGEMIKEYPHFQTQPEEIR